MLTPSGRNGKWLPEDWEEGRAGSRKAVCGLPGQVEGGCVSHCSQLCCVGPRMPAALPTCKVNQIDKGSERPSGWNVGSVGVLLPTSAEMPANCPAPASPSPSLSLPPPHMCTHHDKRSTANKLQATLYSLWLSGGSGVVGLAPGEGSGQGFSWRSGRRLAGATACHGCDAQTAPGGEGLQSHCCPCNPPSPAGTAAHGSRGTGTQPTCRQRWGQRHGEMEGEDQDTPVHPTL